MTYRPIETMPADGWVRSVLTRAKNVRGCRIMDGERQYRSVHGEWHADKYDPAEFWWDGPVPGAQSGRYRYATD